MRSFLIFTICFVLVSTYLFSQETVLNKTFDKDTSLYIFKSNENIYDLKISADINIPHEWSLIRVVLQAQDSTEYLVFESYYEIADTDCYSIELACDETESLNGLSPMCINIYTIDASVKIQAVHKTTDFHNKRSLTAVQMKRITKEKEQAKIKKINKNLRKTNALWLAEETYFSRMTHEEKKAYFGNRKYHTHGWEYYSKGIFEIKDYKSMKELGPMYGAKQKSASISPYIDHFDWREQHGANNPNSPYYTGDPIDGWCTNVKQQWGATCWAFSAVGLTELYVNLYYNQALDLDLSEHNLAACLAGNSGAYRISEAMRHITRTGVVDENCFPNPVDEICGSCQNVYTNPSDKIEIVSYRRSYFPYAGMDELKQRLLYSPLTFSIPGHGTVLVAYRIIQQGDILYYNGDIQVTVPANDQRIGRVCWIVKNSIGPNYDDNGYSNYILDNVNHTEGEENCWFDSKVTSLQNTDDDIRCVDLDGDGYYNWGIYPHKPSTCPECSSNDKDGDDSDPTLGPRDQYGYCTTIPNPITYPDIEITSNTTWSSKQILCSNLIVKNGATLTINDYLKMPYISHIKVESGGSLILDGGRIRFANIVVEPYSNLTISNAGVLELYKNDEIIIRRNGSFNHINGEIIHLETY